MTMSDETALLPHALESDVPASLRAARGLPIGQILRFLAVGGASYCFNLGTYSLFLWVGIGYLVAAALSFLIGFAFNFFANRHWTFVAGGTQAGGQFVRFSCVAALVLALDLVLLRVAVGELDLGRVIAQGVVILFLAPLSFALNRFWSFAQRPAAGPRSRRRCSSRAPTSASASANSCSRCSTRTSSRSGR
jgi:putative flippase GtrA